MSENQRSSENFDREIKTVWIIIYWDQWSGKTVMAMNLAYDKWPKRIYANFSMYRDGTLVNHYLEDVMDVHNIRFSNTEWVIVIDEAGINANSKDSRSEQSRILQEILFLVRKKNCSLIWISQRFESIDVNARVLSKLIIKMDKLSRGEWHPPIFIATRQRQKGAKVEYVNQFKVDNINMMKAFKLTYNTLEASKFKKKKKEEKEKAPKWDK